MAILLILLLIGFITVIYFIVKGLQKIKAAIIKDSKKKEKEDLTNEQLAQLVLSLANNTSAAPEAGEEPENLEKV